METKLRTEMIITQKLPFLFPFKQKTKYASGQFHCGFAKYMQIHFFMLSVSVTYYDSAASPDAECVLWMRRCHSENFVIKISMLLIICKRHIGISITGTLPSDKLLIFFLKPNLTFRHACLEVRIRVFMT